MKAGAKAKVEPDDRVRSNALRVAELDAERASWSRAVNDLAAETRQAAEAVQQARERVDLAIQAVMREEAESIAARAESLAAEALRERLKLGGLYSHVDQMRGLSAAAIRGIRANAEVMVNSPEYHA